MTPYGKIDLDQQWFRQRPTACLHQVITWINHVNVDLSSMRHVHWCWDYSNFTETVIDISSNEVLNNYIFLNTLPSPRGQWVNHSHLEVPLSRSNECSGLCSILSCLVILCDWLTVILMVYSPACVMGSSGRLTQRSDSSTPCRDKYILVMYINSLHAKFFSGDKNIYLHFVSFLPIDMTPLKFFFK